MRRCRRFIFITVLLIVILSYPRPDAGAAWDLTDFFPLGANIIQIIPDSAFDDDDDVEYLCLYSLQGRLGVTLLDRRDQRYLPVFHKTLGVGDPQTGGRMRFANTAYTYRILQYADLDNDGILEFWTIFQPENASEAEMIMYKYKNNSYLQVFSVQGQYDIQFMDYSGELVIHSVFHPEGGQNEELLEIKSAVWNLLTNELAVSPERYQITRKEYLNYARSRRRPQFFSAPDEGKGFSWRWGDSLNKLQEIPLGERAITPLLPADTLLIQEIASDPALDVDIEEEYVITYFVADKLDNRRLRMLAALVDWDFERCRYRLTPLPFEASGLARDPEGYFFRTIYILPGAGVNHLAFLGNGERLSSLKLSILNNTGLFFKESAVFRAGYNLQLFERYSYTGHEISYEVITADLEPDGRVRTKVWKAVPQGAYAEFGPFNKSKEEVLSCREYKNHYYRVQEPVWSEKGYEWLILTTDYAKVNPFNLHLPETEFPGQLEDYIFKYMTPLRIHQWEIRDLDNDGKAEALLLIRMDEDYLAWPPNYRLGLLFRDEKLRLESIGHYPLQIGEGNPTSGVYSTDLTGNGINEIIILTREYNPETKKPQTYLEIMEKVGMYWKKLKKETWYDDLRLYKIGEEVWLYGFASDEKAVYELKWKDGRFSYQKKEEVKNFLEFVGNLPAERVDFLSDRFRIFPPPSRDIKNESKTLQTTKENL